MQVKPSEGASWLGKGTLTKFRKIQTKLEETKNVNKDLNIQLEAEICRVERELKEEQRRAFIVSFG